VRSNRYRDSRTEGFEDQTNVSCRNPVVSECPTLKLEGKLVAGWAEQARCLVTKDVLPKGLIVDLTEVGYIDSVGEQLLKWLASVGPLFVAGSIYAFAVSDRLRLLPLQRISDRQNIGITRRGLQLGIPSS